MSQQTQLKGLQETAQKLEGYTTVNADELLVGENAVSEQLIQLVADDHAIEDTIFYLSKGIGQGKMDLEGFLKVVASSFTIALYTDLILECSESEPRAIYDTSIS